MHLLTALWSNPFAQAAVWSAATIGCYALAKAIYRRWPAWWSMPLTVAPLLLAAAVAISHTRYPDYMRDTHWLVLLLGPTTVAFAIPIYQQRAMIRRYWPVLVVGVIAGSASAMLSVWGLTSMLGLGGVLRLSLLPRSMSTPFAMVVSHDIGGEPGLTAVFTAMTGVLGGIVGQVLLNRLPIASALARGAAFGMGAHGIGTAKARELGNEEGSIAGLVMVLVGVCNVLAAPLLAALLH